MTTFHFRIPACEHENWNWQPLRKSLINSRHFYLFLVKKIFHVRIPSRCAFSSFELWRLITVWSRRRRLCSTNRIQTKPTPIYMFFVVRHLRVSRESPALQNANSKLSKGLISPMKGKISLTRTKRSYLLLSRSIKKFPNKEQFVGTQAEIRMTLKDSRLTDSLR